jgi:hypothetical protein
MNGSSPLAILLVVKPESDRLSLLEDRQGLRIWNNGAIGLSELDILYSELDGPRLDVGTRHRVLPDSQEKEKGSSDDVGGNPDAGRLWSLVKCPSIFNCGDGQCELGLWRRIVVLVGFQEVAERQVELFGAIASTGAVVSRQLEGLRHVKEDFFHALESNLACLAEDVSSNPGGKGKEVTDLGGFVVGSEPWAHSACAGVSHPVLPSGGAGLVIHCLKPNCRPRSVEITLDNGPLHRASPFASFFSEMGSLASGVPVVAGMGNTLCIAWSVARAVRWRNFPLLSLTHTRRKSSMYTADIWYG